MLTGTECYLDCQHFVFRLEKVNINIVFKYVQRIVLKLHICSPFGIVSKFCF